MQINIQDNLCLQPTKAIEVAHAMLYFLLLLFLLSWLSLYFLCMHCDVKFTFTRTTKYRAKKATYRAKNYA